MSRGRDYNSPYALPPPVVSPIVAEALPHSAHNPNLFLQSSASLTQASSSNPGNVSKGKTKVKGGSEEDEEEDDDIDVDQSVEANGTNTDEKKKSTRGTKACSVCRRLKMRCVGAEEGPPCKRCKTGGHECIFEESMRGRRTNRKTDAMAKSLKQMEVTLANVLKSIAQPSHGPSLSHSPSSYSQPLYTASSLPLPPTAVPARSPSSSSTSGHGPAHFYRTPSIHGAMSIPGTHQGEVRYENLIEGLPETTLAWDHPKDEGRRTHDGENPRLHSLPVDTLNPLGLLAEASLHNHRKRSFTLNEVLEQANGDLEPENDERPAKSRKFGVANTRYFQPGPLNILPLRRIVIEHRMPPTLLVEKILTIEEVVELFDLFFSKCHTICPLLDPVLHTPTATGSRSPFLFTCICTVASRYYTKRPDDLYRKCLREAKKTAFDVMAKGFKSPEICQGFLLLCQWNQPAERFEQERVYQFSGIAVRMAADLNLNRKTTAVLPDDTSDEVRTSYEREILNRERCWMYAFICDRSVASQMGKMSCIPREDLILRGAKSWYRQRTSQRSDLGVCAMVELHRIVSRILETLYSDTQSISGLNTALDYPILMRSFLNQLDQWKADWTVLDPQDPDDLPDGVRTSMRNFYHSYYRLFILSFAVQHALEVDEAHIELPRYCAASFQAAADIIINLRDYLGPRGYFRYATDSSFVFVSYACCFLLKLVSPAFSAYVDTDKALELVTQGAEALELVAVDSSHTPALYASFIRALLENKRNGGRSGPGSRVPTRPTSPVLGPAESHNGTRQPSVGLEGYFGGLFGENTDVAGVADTYESMDTMLNDGFWSNMMMPGFGAQSGLTFSGGTALFNNNDPFSLTPFQSRAGSPSATGSSFDFHA